ncbi:LysM peptidoglycan-binding domain-containing protein [Thermodesulfobacteriota bacterium]
MNDKKIRNLGCVHLETPGKQPGALKWLTGLIALTVMVLLPFSLFAEEAEQDLKHEAGFYYTIQKGDTLWDLSQRFSDSPWVWPELWRGNDQIPNPHRIYPGQRIRLYHREGVKKIAKTVVEEQAVQEEAVQKEPPYYFYSEIESIGFIRKVPVDPHGTVFKSKDNKVMISQGDTVYIKPMGSAPLIPGSRYYTYRTLEPKTKAYAGIQHYMTGVVEVVKEESSFIVASVAKSFRDLRNGDLLMPFIERSPKITIAESTPGIEGKIIIPEEFGSIMGDDHVAFIDKGNNDGITPGQLYPIYYEDELGSIKEGDLALAPVDFGTFLVLHTEPTTSTVLITGSDKDIHPGASFRSPLR